MSSISIDASTKINLERKNCGATTGFVYELKTADPDGGEGDLILRFDSDHRMDWPDDDKMLVDLKWLNGDQLEVYLQVPARISHENYTLNGKPIRYHYQAGTTKL